MNRRTLGLAALALLPGAAAAGDGGATAPGRRPRGQEPGGSAAAAPGTARVVEWEGFSFDATAPCTAYVVERTDTLSGGTVGLVFFLPGYDPIGPVTHPASGVFGAAAVGDAFQLGVAGVVNDEG